MITFAIPIAREGLAVSRKADFLTPKIEKIIEKTDKNKVQASTEKLRIESVDFFEKKKASGIQAKNVKNIQRRV